MNEPSPSSEISPRFRAFDTSSIAVYALFSALLSIDVAKGIAQVPGAAWLPLPIAMGAYLASDFVSGFVHYLADNFGTPDTPFVGQKFIRSFRDHHTDPKGITRHDFVETNADNCLVSLLPMVPAWLFLPIRTSVWGFAMGTFVLFLVTFVLFTNQFHKWAHETSPPSVARFLQRWGLILTPDHHQVHHTPPHESYYCITCGWLNPLLTKIRFFPLMTIVLSPFLPVRGEGEEPVVAKVGAPASPKRSRV
jgi:hypothetical protein